MKDKINKRNFMKSIFERGIFYRKPTNKKKYNYRTIIEVKTNTKFENLKNDLKNFKDSFYEFTTSGEDKVKIKIDYDNKKKFNSIINKYF